MLKRIQKLFNNSPEKLACASRPADDAHFNNNASLPHGLQISDIQSSMNDFVAFSSMMSSYLQSNSMDRLESMIMPANYSSIVSEFMVTKLAEHCPTLVKNTYHNGHPDLVPSGVYPNDSCQYGNTGIEVKASRYMRGWQGHNAENNWLMVFCFDSNRPSDKHDPKPFRFVKVYLAHLEESDWNVSKHNPNSRRTRTATINRHGYEKLSSNWIYSA